MSYAFMLIHGPNDGEFKLAANHSQPVQKLHVPTIYDEIYTYVLVGEREYTTPNGTPAPVYEYICTGYNAERTKQASNE